MLKTGADILVQFTQVEGVIPSSFFCYTADDGIDLRHSCYVRRIYYDILA